MRRLLAEAGPEQAWRALEAGFGADDDPVELFHLAGEVLRAGGEPHLAELFDRAADAPHDVQRLLELGSHLLGQEQPDAAAIVLERALTAAPFDAVVRSEVAIAHARAGRPDRVVETLALHPCLADDPGALFQFAWASLLTGDVDAAEGALGQLHGAPTLRTGLENAIERARIGLESSPPRARDFLFIEHGALLLDDGGPLAGRYGDVELDAALARRLVGLAGAVLHELVPSPRRVAALDERHAWLAEAVASACGGTVLAPGKRAAVLVLDRAERIEEVGRESLEPNGVVLALVMETSRALPRAPDVVGRFARSVTGQVEGGLGEVEPLHDAALESFVEARRAWLTRRASAVRMAYVPDAPLPR